MKFIPLYHRHGSRSNHPFDQSDRSIKNCPKYLFTTACATDLILTTISKMENDVTWFRDINSSLIVAERQINTVLFKLHKNTRKLDWTRTGLVRCLFVDNRFVNASSPLYFIALVLPSKQISRLTRKVAPVQLPATIGYGCPFGLNSARFLFDFFVFSVITSDADFDPTFAIHNDASGQFVASFKTIYEDNVRFTLHSSFIRIFWCFNFPFEPQHSWSNFEFFTPRGGDKRQFSSRRILSPKISSSRICRTFAIVLESF